MKLKIVDALLTLILRMRQGACRCSFVLWRLPISEKWISATNQNMNYPRCEGKIRWRSVDTNSQNGAVTMLLSLLPIKPAMHQLCITDTKSLFNYCTYKTWNRWHSIDAHFNALSIQHLLPSIIVFIMIRTYRYSFWQIETWPSGKAEHSNILALFALTQLKFMYLAKSIIVPTIHLFINPLSQATAHHSLIIYV